MNIRRSESALEKPDSTERGPGRSGRPAQITNSYLPPIEELPRRRRGRARDIFAPAEPANDPFDVSTLLKDIEGPSGPDGRRWPTLPDAPRDPAGDLERIIEEQRAELDKRCVQIADMSHAHQQQEEALLLAREAIESLDTSVTLLRRELTQQENEAAAARQELQRSGEEKIALQAKLEETSKALAELSQRKHDTGNALNKRDALIAAARDRIVLLEAELSARTAENTTLAAAAEENGKRSRNETDERRALLERRIEELQGRLADRDQKIRKQDATIADLDARHSQLLQSGKTSEADRGQTQEILRSQAESITTLATALRAERETADRKIAALTDDLRREREERSVVEREAAAFRREIALLLPQIATVTKPVA